MTAMPAEFLEWLRREIAREAARIESDLAEAMALQDFAMIPRLRIFIAHDGSESVGSSLEEVGR